MRARFAVCVLPKSSVSSNVMSSEVTPRGTSHQNANISTLSRFHVMGFPFAEMCRLTRLLIGPVGECSPGIHFG